MAEASYPIEEEKKGSISSERNLEIEKIKQHLSELESQLEKEHSFESKEIAIKQEIKNYLQQLQETSSSPSSPIEERDEVKEIEKFEHSQQIGSLIALVFEKGKGLSKAISLARALNNPAILDEFHDALVNYYYEKLIENKVIKP